MNTDVIISCAVTGAGDTTGKSNKVPVTPRQIADAAIEAAHAGAAVTHIGAVGPDGATMVARLRDFGVDCAHVSAVDTPTAHAIINVDPAGARQAAPQQ